MENTKKILVTGATGFLGGRLVEILSQQGEFQIVATGRNKTKGVALTTLANVRFVVADLCKKKEVQRLCKGIDIVIHCAARSSLWGTYKEFYNANVVLTDIHELVFVSHVLLVFLDVFC